MPIVDSKGRVISGKLPPPSLREFGATGRAYAQRFQQLLDTDEYLNALRFPDDVAIYEKMARSDGQVKAILLMLSLPIRATQWFVRPKDDSQEAKKVANYVNDCLFGGYGIGLNSGFDEFIKNVTTMFQFGHSIFEKVFEIRQGKIKWKKFAVRPQSTIYEIYYDEVGDCKGIDQYNIKENWETVYIPIEKLLVFSHDMQQGNVRGMSVLRSAYKHWSIKDFLYKIVNVGIERNFVGTPVLTLPEGYTEEDKDLADEIVATLRSHQFGGVRLPAGFVLDMFEGKRTLADVQPYIDHHDNLIAKCILSSFMNLGSGSSSSGSFALSSDQSQMYLMMLDSSAKNICSVMNTHAIPEIVNYNFITDLYPELAFKPMNSTKIINTLKTLVDGKIVLPDDDMEAYIRDMLDFPKANPAQNRKEIAEQFKQNQLIAQSSKDEQGKMTSDKKNPELTKSKNPIDNKSKQKTYSDKIKNDNVDKKMSELSIDYANLPDDISRNLENIINRQIISLKEKAEVSDFNSLSSIKVQHKGELTKLVGNIVKMTLKLSESDIKFTAKSNIISNNISETVKSTFLNDFIDNNEINTEEITSRIIKSL